MAKQTIFAEDFIGRTIKNLTIVKELPRVKDGLSSRIVVECICSCGKTKAIRLRDISNGKTKSCGCRGITPKGERVRQVSSISVLVGSSDHPFYVSYYDMIRRCYSETCEAYPDYGGRGITVCPSWRNSFETFYFDMFKTFKEGLKIERTDPNGNYTPENCSWETQTVQSHNTRKHRNSSSKYKGVTWDKNRDKWKAGIAKEKVHINIGRFSSEEAAARAYDDASEKLYGDRPNEKLGLLLPREAS